ncbi:MAG: quinone-dependent dihydroorotate dehydrogenase [Alphaproteobacteria bacterium]|nr:quinone-dependent dihydroorotate dehydrogenase [Alphaproteobacteria bacterium]
MSRIHDLTAAALRRLPAERAHNLTLWGLARGLGPHRDLADDPALGIDLWDRHFTNPIGMAAGFDKNAGAIAGVLDIGFGFHEIGGITPAPQTGNPRPRLFRLAADQGLINRMGFNNDGLDAIADRLAQFRGQTLATEAGRRPIVGANLAANTDSAEPIDDFVRSAVRLSHLADFLTIDISCPNTVDGQQFLEPGPLGALLAALAGAVGPGGAERRAGPSPRLIKLSPDIDDDRLKTLIGVALEARIDGIVVANTSTARPPDLVSRHRAQQGGLSGRPLFAPSTRMLARVARETEGRVPLIGVGGIAGGRDAYAKIRAGASLVQLYTALIYRGPSLVGRIKAELAGLLKRDGFATLADAVGADHR